MTSLPLKVKRACVWVDVGPSFPLCVEGGPAHQDPSHWHLALAVLSAQLSTQPCMMVLTVVKNCELSNSAADRYGQLSPVLLSSPLVTSCCLSEVK